MRGLFLWTRANPENVRYCEVALRRSDLQYPWFVILNDIEAY